MRFLTILLTGFIAVLTFWANDVIAQSVYALQPGDRIRVEVLEDNSLNREILVAPDGRITLPLAGSVQAGGRSVDQVAASITVALEDDFTVRPNVFVTLVALAPRGPILPVEPETLSIFVLGEVDNSGVVQVEPGTSIIQLFAITGFTNFAATRRIQLRRTGPDGKEKIFALNYDAMLSGQSPNGAATLLEGDVIVVPQRKLFE